MKLVNKFWNNFKTQPDIWFFYGFLITFPFSIRKVLFFYPAAGQFNEYTGIYLYLSDIFLILTILAWILSILYNKISILSILRTALPRRECSTWNILWGKREAFVLFVLPLALVTWSFLSILWSSNENLALFRSIKLLEFYLLFIYVVYNVSPTSSAGGRGIFLRNIFRIIIFLGLFEAIIGIWQFIAQHSIGLFWLKESLISPELPGVAKIILGGEKFIRAYGLFPHPNILGGFLLISIILTWQYKKLFRPENSDFVPRLPAGEAGGTKSENGASMEQNKVDVKTIIFLIVQILALILTFSKSAWIGLLIATGYVIYNNVPRLPAGEAGGTLITIVKNQWRKIILIFAVLLALAVIAKPNINSLLFNSLNERIFYLNVSRGTILGNPMLGVGNGQFVPNMQSYTAQALENWQYQPVHNVFLLIWSELGLIGLILFIWWLWKLFNLTPILFLPRKGTEGEVLGGILLSFIFIMLFDHYLWDIQQGQIMLWLVLGILASKRFQAIGILRQLDKL